MKLSEKFEEALVYATHAHANQMRKKTGIPFVAHILGVTAIALEYGANETEAIGALLHDTVEDCGGAERLRDIREKFGDDVARIVDGCTDTYETPKPPWRERKERYLAHLADAPGSVRLVSSADKLHNARSVLSDYRLVGEDLWSRFNGGKEGTLWYYRAIVDVLRGDGPVVEDLDRVVTELEAVSGDGDSV